MNRRPVVVEWREQIRDSGLDRTAKAVAWGLSTYMSPTGWCKVGRATIARACSITDRAVDGALARLEDAAMLLVTRSAGGNPRAASNEYQALLTREAGSPLTREAHAGVPANGKHSAANGETLSGERRSPEQEEVEEQEWLPPTSDDVAGAKASVEAIGMRWGGAA